MGLGQPLDSILIQAVLEGPETISPSFESDIIRLDNREDEFSIQLDYDNGSAVNMTLSLEVSTDGVTFVPLASSSVNITDNTGTHIWDISGTGTNFMKVVIDGTGSIDIQRILYSGKRRH